MRVLTSPALFTGVGPLKRMTERWVDCDQYYNIAKAGSEYYNAVF